MRMTRIGPPFGRSTLVSLNRATNRSIRQKHAACARMISCAPCSLHEGSSNMSCREENDGFPSPNCRGERLCVFALCATTPVLADDAKSTAIFLWARVPESSMVRIAVIALSLIFATFSSATAEPSCARHSESSMCWVSHVAAGASTIDGRRVADVLCCCRTYSGGDCCIRVAQCGTKLPGCFCASPGVPGARRLSSVVLDR